MFDDYFGVDFQPSMSGKIAPESGSGGKTTLAAFSKFLVTILAIPVKTDRSYTSANFNWFGLRTFLFCIIYYAAPVSFLLSQHFQEDFTKDLSDVVSTIYGPFDNASGMFFNSCLFFGIPTLLLVLAEAFSKVSKISMAHNLKSPENLKILLLLFLFSLFGGFFTNLGMFTSVSPRLSFYPWPMTFFYLFLAPFTCHVLSTIYWVSCLSIVSAWMTHVTDICNMKPPKMKEVVWARHCLHLYGNIENGLGVFFLFGFPLCQIMWIFSLFLAITLPIGSNVTEVTSISFTCIGYFLLSFCFLLALIICAFPCADLHASLANVIDTLEDLPVTEKDRDVEKLMKSLDKTGPLTCFGLFQIDRSILTSMVATSLTYLIILVQFKQSML